ASDRERSRRLQGRLSSRSFSTPAARKATRTSSPLPTQRSSSMRLAVGVTRRQDRLNLVEVCRRLLRSDAEALDVRIQQLGYRAEIPGDERTIALRDRVPA